MPSIEVTEERLETVDDDALRFRSEVNWPRETDLLDLFEGLELR
jgi:hypothetical protein